MELQWKRQRDEVDQLCARVAESSRSSAELSAALKRQVEQLSREVVTTEEQLEADRRKEEAYKEEVGMERVSQGRIKRSGVNQTKGSKLE